jgi:hypothetical protein
MNTKTKKALNEQDKATLTQLKAQIAEIEGEDKTDLSDNKIQQDEYIPVMSLLPYNLNLTTREGGQGNIKKFTKFGEIKNIMYKDLADIVDVHTNFMEAGYFYILDPRFIRQHGLDETYSKILTKEKIEEILTTNSDCVALYKSANEEQQRVIVNLLIEKVVNDPDSLDLNTVDKIARISKVDITKIAEDRKALSDKTEVEE